MLAPAAPVGPTYSSVVHVRDVSYLTLAYPSRAVCQLGPATVPLEVARTATRNALEARDAFQVKMWAMLTCFFETEGVGTALTSVVAQAVVRDLIGYLNATKDLQTVGLIACLLEIFARGELVRIASLWPRSFTDEVCSAVRSLQHTTTPLSSLSQPSHPLETTSPRTTGHRRRRSRPLRPTGCRRPWPPSPAPAATRA